MTMHADRDHSEPYWPPTATREPRVRFPLDDGDTGAALLPVAPAGTLLRCPVCPAALADTRGGRLDHCHDGTHHYVPSQPVIIPPIPRPCRGCGCGEAQQHIDDCPAVIEAVNALPSATTEAQHDLRPGKYAEAMARGFGYRCAGAVPEDAIRAVMAVADAEQAELSRGFDGAYEQWRDRMMDVEESAEAAERALADERANVARGAAALDRLIESVETDDSGDPTICHDYDRTDDGTCALLADLRHARGALVSPEPEATGDDEEFCPKCLAGLMSSEHHQKCIVPEREAAEAAP